MLQIDDTTSLQWASISTIRLLIFLILLGLPLWRCSLLKLSPIEVGVGFVLFISHIAVCKAADFFDIALWVD